MGARSKDSGHNKNGDIKWRASTHRFSGIIFIMYAQSKHIGKPNN